MEKLTVPLSAMGPEGVRIDAEVGDSDVRPEGVEAPRVHHLTLTGSLKPVAHEFLFQGSLSGTVETECDRCLESFDAPVAAEVTWVFVESAEPHPLTDDWDEDDADMPLEADGGAITAFSGNAIELAPRLWEEVVLAVPGKSLCSEDCQGLCVKCGTNLNREECGCTDDESETLSNSGFGQLKDMFPDLKPDKTPED